MKRTIFATILALSAPTSAALADNHGGDGAGAVNEDTTMKLGVGVARTLGGNTGVEAEYYLGDQLMLAGMFGFTSVSSDADGVDTATNIFLAGAGFYRLRGTGRSALMVGGRLVIGNASSGATGGEDGSTQFNLEIPLRIELWINKVLSFHVESGLLLAFVPENGAALAPGGPADGSVVRLGGNLFGAGGITVYLP